MRHHIEIKKASQSGKNIFAIHRPVDSCRIYEELLYNKKKKTDE